MSLRSFIHSLVFRLRGDHSTENLIKKGLVVGKNFNRMVGTILDPAHCWHIHIGDNVTLAPRVHVLAHDASFCHHVGYARVGNVNIGNNVFVGADSVILPGVTIGDNCVIGANSTVTRDIPAGSVAAGNPARVICSIDEYTEKAKKQMADTEVFGDEYTLRNPDITDEMKARMYESATKNRYIFVK